MRLAGIVGVVLVMACASSLYGSAAVYEPYAAFSGASPSGPGPWLRIVFDDHGTAGPLDFTLEAVGLTDPEFVSKLYFNLDPSLDPCDLSFSGLTKTGQFDDPKFSTGADKWNVAGSGRYDVELKFSTSGSGGGAKRFRPGEILNFTISGIPTLRAMSFDLDSTGGGNGAYPVAVHVQGINGNDSGGESAPDPATLCFLGGGVLALVKRRRRT